MVMQSHAFIIYLINRVDGLDWNGRGIEWRGTMGCRIGV